MDWSLQRQFEMHHMFKLSDEKKNGFKMHRNAVLFI